LIVMFHHNLPKVASRTMGLMKYLMAYIPSLVIGCQPSRH